MRQLTSRRSLDPELSAGPRASTALSPLAVLVVGELLALWWAHGEIYNSTVLLQGVTFVLLAQGFNIVGGLGGRLAFGNTIFFGMGALSVIGGVANGWYPALVGLVIGVVLAVIVASSLTYAFWKLTGLLFALVTFALSTMLQELTSLGTIFGGPSGLEENLDYHSSVVDLNLTSPYAWAIAGTILVLLCTVFTWWVRRRSWGEQLVAIRDDLPAASASGINARRVSAQAWAVSAVISVLAGAFYVQANGSIDSPTAFGLTTGTEMITAVIVGGIGTTFGPVIGGALVAASLLLNRLSTGDSLPGLNELVYGAVLIATVRLAPGGVAGLWGSLRRRQGQRRAAAGPAGQVRPAPLGRVEVRAAGPSGPVDLPASPDRELDRGAPVLSVREVRKTFGGLTALDGVDLDVWEAEIVGLVGPNGAGKSTLFSCVHGSERTSEGTILFDGARIDRMATFERARLGIGRTFQTTRLFLTLTTLENIGMPMMATGMSPREARDRAREIGDAMGLSPIYGQRVGDLSQVDQRRIELARGVAVGRRLVLLDEVMAGLAENEAEAIGDLILSLRNRYGTAVLIVEHVMGRIAPIADRIVVMDFGRVIAAGPPEEVFRDETVQAAYLGVLGGAGGRVL